MQARGNLALLLSDLRTWKPGPHRKTAHQLARQYDVEYETVLIVAKSYGIHLGAPGVPYHIDSEATTQPIDLMA